MFLNRRSVFLDHLNLFTIFQHVLNRKGSCIVVVLSEGHQVPFFPGNSVSSMMLTAEKIVSTDYI